MAGVKTVFRKELRDALRDRRSMLSMLIFPLVGPVLTSLVLATTAETMTGSSEFELPMVGREHAPQLVAYLEQRGVKAVDPPADIVAAVRDQRVKLVLVVPKEYPEQYRAGHSAELEMVVDSSRNDSQADVHRVRALLQAHSQGVGALRLLARGVNPDLAHPLKIAQTDLSTPRKKAALFLNFVPMFVLLATFIGGMYVATDSTAGERERGSLEPLLITPVSRRALTVGKWLVSALFAGLTVLLTLLTTLVALSQVSFDKLGLSVSLTPRDVVLVLVATLPLALTVTAAQMLVACFARSFKEAQTYLSLMIFIPMAPAMLFMLSPPKGALWMTATPVLGQQLLLNQVIRGEYVATSGFLLAGAAALLAAFGLLMATARILQREKIIFGR